jgi:YihY family inner membrane protein
VLVAFGLTLIYRYGPSRTEPRWQWITWGGAFAAITWLAASALFSWYAANFGTFNKIYGSLGAIVGFMMWMWLSMIVILGFSAAASLLVGAAAAWYAASLGGHERDGISSASWGWPRTQRS